MITLKRLSYYASVYKIQMKNNYVREAVYRTNFVTSLIVDLIWYAIEFAFFGIIYANTSYLGGWTQEQVYFFLGVFFASDSLFTIFFNRNFWEFSDLVNKGELDTLLTKPISPVFLALTRFMSLSAVINFGLGLAISIVYAERAGFKGGLEWLTYPLWLLVGVLAALLLRFFFSIWVFWTDRSWALVRLYYQFFMFASKPESIYPRAVRYALMTVLPFGIIGSVPARALMQGLKTYEYAIVFVVLVGFYFLNRTLWIKGMKRYQSASS